MPKSIDHRAQSIIKIIDHRAQYQSDKQAYIFLENGETESASLTYGELDRLVRAIAAQIQDWQGERALLLYNSGLEFITAFFGCLYAGVVAVPVYPPRRNQKLSRLLSIVNDAQAKVVLTTTSILTDIEKRWEEEAGLAQVKLVGTDTIEANPQEFVPKSLTLESLAFLQYTSGSTGTPKGVMVTHGNIIHNQKLIQQAFGHSEQSIGVSWLPLFHDMGLIGHVLQPIYVGVPSILMPPLAFLQKPIRWLKAISQYRATTSGGPNFAYDLCVKKIQPEQLADLDLSSWDLAFNGAEPVRAETLEQFSQKFAQCGFNERAFYPCYGMAETTLFVTGGDKNQKPLIQGVKTFELEKNLVVESEISSPESRVFVGCGHSYMNTRVIIVNPELLTRCEQGQVGEIWVSGGSIAAGYWNCSEATQEAFQSYLKDTGEGPFLRTGDLGFLLDGELFVTGRLKDVIIIRGRNHYPQDIELSVQKSHPALQDNLGAAFSIEVEGEERLVIVQEVERTYIRQLNTDEVVEAINQAILLEHELAIDTIVLLKPGSIPTTSSGKIQRRACRQKFLDRSWQNVVFTKSLQGEISREQEYVPPRTPSEEIIANIFASVLGVQNVGIHDNFFSLGGHSLLATQLISRLRVAFEVEIELRAVFSSPTVAQLDQTLTQLRTSGSGLSLPPIQPRTTTEQLPLSFAQERLWFLNQLEGTSATYNIPGAIRVSGNLDINALEQALSEIVRRHEVLRTSFPTVNGTPIQVIHPEATMNIKVVDLQQLAATARETVLQQQVQQEAITPFDLEIAPLIRCSLLQLEAREYVLLLNMHHIVSDGWSIGVFIAELSSLYQAFIAGVPSPLPELPIQYADFALWQREWMSGEGLLSQINYWLSQLEGTPELLELPTDRTRPSVQSYRGATQSWSLNSDLTQKLETLSRNSGTTLFMTLQAAFSTLLYRYSGQSDILVGTPIACRNRSEIESLIGFFVNTLVLRNRFEDHLSFEQLLTQVRETTLEAYEHQDVPFEQVVEVLQPQRSLSHSPLFQVMFVWQNAPMGELELPGVTLSELNQESTIAKFDLTLSMTETDQGLLGSWEYNTDLFDGSTIERMAAHFENLLSAIVENPQQKVSELPLLSARERHQLLVEWNDTATVYPQDKCIHQLFESQVEKTPDAIAVVFENQQLTYQQLNHRANQLAHHLLSLGVEPEVLVGIYVERSIEMVVGLLGILKAGGAYVPLDPNYPQERLSYMLADSGVEVLLTHRQLLSSLPSHTAQIVCLDSNWGAIEQHSQKNLDVGVCSDNLAYVIYTSGSTGKPKGVQICHRSVVNFLTSMSHCPGLTQEDTFNAVTTICFDIAALELYLPLTVGAKVIIVSREMATNADRLFSKLLSSKITVMQATPATWQMLLAAGWSSNYPLKVLCGGETLSPQLAHQILETGSQLWNLYGPTEATIWSTIYQVGVNKAVATTENAPSYIGRPITNTEIYILDSRLQPVPIGVPGELYIGGDGLARGYLNRPELTSEKFIPNPFDPKSKLYKTGDLARYLPDGNVEYLGRIDNQVKIRGFRIELGEIEAVLNSHPQIQQTVVIATEDITGNKRLVAYVVSEDESLSTQQLREFLKSKLPEYMVPSAFITLDTLPLTPNGKVDRKALPAPDGEISREQEYVAPRTPSEEIIANIIASVLGVQNVGIHDNFFSLGGHSLLATQLISRLRVAFEVEIELRAVFSSPTVAQLDQTLTQLRTSGSELSLPPIQPRTTTEQLPLSFAQERLWFLNQLEGTSATYNIPGAIRVSGNLDINALEQALSEIVRRHEVLRTSFPTVNGTPIQVIHPEATMNIKVVDLQQLAATARETVLQQQVQLEAITPFDLEIAPLIRCSLLQLEAREYVLLLNMHHIVSDGWSIGVFISELSTLYRAFIAGVPSPLGELPIQYADFALWQREWMSGEGLLSQINYWLSQLEGTPELLELPTDRTRPSVQSYRGATQSWSLNSDLTQKLETLSRNSGTTLFMTLQAAFSTLLYRYSGQSDILVGTPIAYRNRSEIESLIGLFVNTLVLRNRFEDHLSFEQLLTQVRETTLEAYEHQDVPFEQVVEVLQPQRSLSHSPLFQVMFVLQNVPMGELELPGVTLSELNQESTIAKFDLTLSMTETDQGLLGSWEYNTDLFDGSTIERMAAHFENLLSAIVENPQQKVSELPLLSAAERHQLLVEWNDTATVYPEDKCIHQLFESQVEKTPDAVAVVFENQQLTYQQLNHRANQLAHHLLSLGVEPEVLVGICVERSIEMVVGLLGILKAGGAYVPLDPTYPQERLSYMLADSGVEVLLTQQKLLSSLPSHTAQVVCLDSNWGAIEQHSQENLDLGVCSNNLAYVIYTSGSTGKPKGVEIEHLSLCNLAQTQRNLFDVEPTSRILQFASVSFDASVSEIFIAVTSGAMLVLGTASKLMPGDDLKQILQHYHVTHVTLPPSALAVLPIDELPGLAQIIVAGEACSIELANQWSVGRRFFNAYGPTESTVCATVAQISDASERMTIGRPIANTLVYILNKHLQPVPIGVTGELYIGGDGLARGYLNRPELTSEKFIPNPFSDDKSERLYKTGDLARYLSDGNIEYIGRIDQQVKIRGFRIELGEIEAVLNSHAQIQQTVVIATEDLTGNKRLVAYVVSEDESLSTHQLREFLKSKLPEYMVPSAFVTLDTLPLTPNGKVDRKALPAPDGEISREQEYVAPRTAIEQVLTNIWQELLQKEQVSIHDNFFEIGGDSILSIQMVSRAKNSGVQITAKQIFQNQTIAELAKVANTTVSVTAQQGIVTGVAPLTPIQQWFFAQNRQEAHHYNQSVLLQIPNHLQTELIETAWKKLLEHHDALRLRFRSVASEHQQINQGFDDTVAFTVVDLSSTPVLEQPQNLLQIATEFQASLNLSDGPLMQVVMFNLGSYRDARLLIIIHHLAVDGVSWRILLSDLETIYQQLITTQPLKLSAKTTAFIDWAEKLNNYAQTEIIKQELDYWLNQPWSKTTPLPLDYADKSQENTVGSTAVVSVKLSIEETQALLGSVNEAYNTQINDILLSALVVSLTQWTGNSTVRIDLEGHGREELFSDVDLSRTVGWFTSLFPVLLQLPAINQPASVIKSIKEQLRAIPNRGIGYGILRYLCEDPIVTQKLQTISPPEICFNYLGQFDQVQSQTGWKFAPESTGANQSLKQTRDHLLEINSLVVEGEFQINWTYSRNIHSSATVDNLAQSYLQAIRSIIEHCQLEDAFGYTPSDFPDAQLNQLELDDLLAPLKTQNISSIYPLSPMQQGMLFHSLYAPESGVYFEQMTLNLKGNVNVATFESTWQKVVDRHSILRTFFVWENRQTPLQVVLKQVNLPWDNLDWQGLSPTEQQQQLSELLQTQRRLGFQFNQAPLMRCALIKLSEDTYKFIWSHHHILMDGWCLPIILREVLSLYEAELRGETCQLPTPSPYRDYIAWLNDQDQETAIEFWQQTLQGFSAPTPLVVDKTQYQNQQQDSDYKELELRLSAQVSRQLQSVAQESHVTLSTIVQAAWGLLLSRYSGEQDVVFGVTVSGRTGSLSGMENLVGLLINTLPLRLQISPDQQLIPWLEQIQQLMWELQHYSYTPLVDIQARSEVPGGIPLFESILVFENYPVESSLLNQGGSLQLGEIEGFEQTNYPLTVVAVPGDELKVLISYDTVRFESDTIGRMLGHLQTIFSAIVENPQQKVSELPLLSARERHQLLVEWNETAREYPRDKCIHQLFESQVEKTPDAVAVVFENQQLTYQQLNHRANQLAHHLLSLGVEPEVLVGICVERSIEMVVGLLGILKAGGAYVPLDPNYPQERLSYMLADSGVEVLLTHRQLLSSLPSHTAQIVCLDSNWGAIEQHSQKNLDVGVCSDNLAYVIYTSGSTGKPKGVQICHRSVVNFLTSMSHCPGLTQEDTFNAVTTICFDIAALELYLPLTVGAKVIIVSREMATNADRLFSKLLSSKITVMQATPATWQMLLAAGWSSNYPLKVLCGGETLSPQLAHQILETGSQLWNLYGPTEATIWSTIYQVGVNKAVATTENAPSYIGRPITNTEIYILDSRLQPVPIGVPGELYIGGDGLARGYLNRPELTSEKFIPNPFDPKSKLYKTGDLARYLPDGNVEYLGRIDNQVKIRGFRIELGEIEAVLNSHPQIQQTVVIATEDITGNKRLVAYVVSEDESLSTQQLREFLKSKLPEYMVPSAFITLDTLPLTPNGKVDRKALPAPDGEISREQEYVAPRTPSEEIIANIIASVLGVQNVGIHDNFFSLGGHSLLATQLISRLRVAFEVEIELRAVFSSPTVAQLDQTLTQLRTSGSELSLPPIQPRTTTEQLPLSFAQERLWFLNQLEGTSATYNIPGAIRVSGNLDINALEQALSEIVRRHEVLRTSFPTVNGTPIQVIHPEATMNIKVVDLQQLAATARETVLQQQVQLEAITPFDLEIAPLIRCSLLQLEAREYVLLLNMHHIVSDGWSIGVFISELSTLYRAFIAGVPSPLGELPIQYADFALWQREWMSGEGLLSQINYWLSQLEGTPELLELPTDRTRPSVQSYRGATQSWSLNSDLTQKLETLSRNSGTTLFMTLQAAFSTLLYRYSGQSDILVGTPIAYRNRSEIESLIGLFVNTLVLRNRFEDHLSFEQLLTQVRETTLEAYEHQDVPFEQVVEVLQPQRSLSHSPLFQVMFVLQNVPMGELELPGVTLSELNQESTIAKFDLTLSMTETDQGLLGSWEYNTDLFDGSTIERMAAHFENLLSAIVENPQQKVSELPLLSARERHQLLVEWNDTVTAYPQGKCIHQLFESQVEKTPDAVAVVFENQQLTYQQLNHRANQLAHHLLSLGVEPEVLVGICVERSIEMVVGLLGILKAGGAYVPLDPNYPQERLSYILNDSQVSILLTQQLLAEELTLHEQHLVCLDNDWETIGQKDNHNPESGVTVENLAYAIYTSGSTGRPKGVMVSHTNVVSFFMGMDKTIGCDPPGSWLAVTSMCFDISVLELLWTITRGFQVVVQAEYAATFASHSKVADQKMDFSLFYFASDNRESSQDKYQLLLEGAKFADAHGFAAVWTPERHFHDFGGVYPNPSVTSAAIAVLTQRIQIRSGSVVLPLHNPIRVAEEWAVVDNLSQGRVGISFAPGWQANDFVFAPENYTNRKQVLLRQLETVHQLWRGESVTFLGGTGNQVPVKILPRPIQPELPTWLTTSGNPETFRVAGEMGTNVLTHLLEQSIEELAEKIRVYRDAWREHGHEGTGHVTLMLHTFVAQDINLVRETVRQPFYNYLRSSIELLKNLAQAVGLDINSEDFTKEDMESLLSHAFDRYFETSSLFGTPNTCLKTIDRLKTIGVDEIACLIDFGVDFDLVMSSLKYLDVVQKRSNKKVNTGGNQDYSLPTQIKKHNISHMQCTPSLVRTLTTNPDALDALRSLQKLMLGGEVLPLSLAEELHPLVSGEVLNMYGPTETTIWSTSYLVNGSEKTIPIGKPIANTEIYILDRHYQPVPIGVPGELFIGGRGVVRGYLNRPELTSERFVLNPFSQKLDNRLYATGDLARYSSDGNIEYLGRLDYQVKIRGFRIELGEIEAVLNSHAQIRQSVVVAREDIPGDKRLIAYVVSSDDTLSTKQLREFLKLKLPEYMVPSTFVTLDTLPLTANGKIDRLGLPIPDGEKRSNLQYISPRNSTEEIIADIFASVLSTQKVSIYDNFFELGGHSLLAIQVISRVKQAFAVDIPLRNMFEEPTIASLSKIIENSNLPLLQQLQTTSYKLGNREEIEL